MWRLLSTEGIIEVILRAIPSIAAARCASAFCCVLMVMGSTGRAQTGGPADPGQVPAQSSKDDAMPPPGACKPIGLTVSGEIVFPLECKEFIERQKALNSRPTVTAKPPSLEPKPTAAEAEKPVDAAAKPATAGETLTPAEPKSVEAKPVETLPAETRPVETESAGAKSAETGPAETGPAETKPVESKPIESKPIEPKAVEVKPVETKPADSNPDEPKTAAKPLEDAAPDNSQASTGALEVVPLPRRADRRLREQAIRSAPGCTHFRSYNAAAGTYRSYDGHTLPCR